MSATRPTLHAAEKTFGAENRCGCRGSNYCDDDVRQENLLDFQDLRTGVRKIDLIDTDSPGYGPRQAIDS